MLFMRLKIHLPAMVKRKTLVLDLDETLIHSHHDGIVRPMVKPGTPPDFILRVSTLDFLRLMFGISHIGHLLYQSALCNGNSYMLAGKIGNSISATNMILSFR